MSGQKTRKVYDVQEARLDKRGPFVAAKPPALPVITGVDGQQEGVARPFPGFVAVHEFDHAQWDLEVEAALNGGDSGGADGSYHDLSSTVVDVFVRDFLIGEDDYGYCIVYRVRRRNNATGATACDVFIDAWMSPFGGTWTLSMLLKEGVPLPQRLDRVNGAQMDVVVFGHMVYILIEGLDPVLFYREKDTPFASFVVTTPGPGPKPHMDSPVTMNSLGSIVAPEGTEAARGQVVLLQYLPNETGLFPSWSYGSGSGTGSGSGDEDESGITWLEPGDYSFAIQLVDSGTGRRSSISTIAVARLSDFEIQESGSGSGAYSNLYAAVEILYEEARYDQAYVYRSLKLQDAGGTMIGNVLKLDRIIDLEEYQTLNNPGAVTSGYAQSIYWYELEDKQLFFQEENVDFKTYDDYVPKAGAGVMYDGTLVLGKIRSSGAASSLEVRSNDLFRGATEIRWSATLDVMPEMFPPSNRYVPSLPANEVLVFHRLGPNIIGWSRDRQYLGRKEGGYLRFYEMLEGFGAVNQRAVEPVGSLAYFATSKGLKSVTADGQLEDLVSLNHVFVTEWIGSMEEISLAFDSHLGALFVHNATHQEAYVLWFNTARVTKLADMGFSLITRGPWPRDFEFDEDNIGPGNTTYLHPLEERAFFVDNPAKITASEQLSGYTFRLYMVDTARSKLRTGALVGDAAATRYSMMPFEGDSVFAVADDFVSNADHRLDVVFFPQTGGREVSPTMFGGWLYVLSAQDASLVGTKYRVRKSDAPVGGGIYLAEDPVLWNGALVEGDVVGYSPVFVEIVGSAMGLDDDPEGFRNTNPADFFRQRHIESVAVAATSIQGEALDETLSPIARYQGVLYTGDDSAPDETAETRDQSGALVASLVQGASTFAAVFGAQPSGASLTGTFGRSGPILMPGIRVFCPDLDFQLLALKVTGQVLSSDSSTVITE